MALHPQCAAFLAPGADAPELIDLPLNVGRAGAYADMSISGEIRKNIAISNQFIPGETADILIRIYRPAGSNLKNGLVYFHGGGWSYFSVDMYDAQLSALADLTDSVIISVNYQKSPEHKFPIPHDDCFTGLKWVFAHANELGIDETKIGIGGDSAGGNLAAAAALLAVGPARAQSGAGRNGSDVINGAFTQHGSELPRGEKVFPRPARRYTRFFSA